MKNRAKRECRFANGNGKQIEIDEREKGIDKRKNTENDAIKLKKTQIGKMIERL